MNRLSLYLSFVMVAVLFLLSALCFFTEVFQQYAEGPKKYLLGTIVLLYAIIRAVRIKKQLLDLKRQER